MGLRVADLRALSAPLIARPPRRFITSAAADSARSTSTSRDDDPSKAGPSTPRTTHFGFRDVPEDQKETLGLSTSNLAG